jgi:hypothetical protein
MFLPEIFINMYRITWLHFHNYKYFNGICSTAMKGGICVTRGSRRKGRVFLLSSLPARKASIRFTAALSRKLTGACKARLLTSASVRDKHTQISPRMTVNSKSKKTKLSL